MKKLLIILFVLCSCYMSYSQPLALLGMDSNPRLNETESAFLQRKFPAAVFSFHDKHVGFSELAADTTKSNTVNLWRVTKSRYFANYENGQHEYAYRLYILNSKQRKATNGYDAIVLFTEKKIEEKLQQCKDKDITQFYWLNYTEIPDDAGSDNGPVLNQANADFFHALYAGKGAVPKGYSFPGKKIAILDTHDWAANPMVKSIGEYVAKVRECLLLHEQNYNDYIYMLSDEQKKQSGGYDVIIQYMTNKPVPVDEMVRFLAEEEKHKAAGQ